MITAAIAVYTMIGIGFGAQSYSYLRKTYGKQDHGSTICAAVVEFILNNRGKLSSFLREFERLQDEEDDR